MKQFKRKQKLNGIPTSVSLTREQRDWLNTKQYNVSDLLRHLVSEYITLQEVIDAHNNKSKLKSIKDVQDEIHNQMPDSSLPSSRGKFDG